MRLFRWLDEQYTGTPYLRVRRVMAAFREAGYAVNPKRVRRLFRHLGLETVFSGPRTSQAAPGHRVYPYLLRGVSIERVNHVWSSDIIISGCGVASSTW